ncbi:hypothetical protein OIV83_002039 [Microbotryomycetes sp. JL201]|nr:hypothetical protein OIV83_002039 [Microbotryomycetes sp. JL201]
MPRSTRSSSLSSSGASSLASTAPSTPPSDASVAMSPWSKPQELVPVPSRRQASGAHADPGLSGPATSGDNSKHASTTKSYAQQPQQHQQQDAVFRNGAQTQQQPNTFKSTHTTRLAKRPKRYSRARQWLIYWESTSVLSMLEPWEKALVYLVLLLLSSMFYWAITNYLPAHVRAIVSRAVYYVRGGEGPSHETAAIKTGFI